MRLSEIRLSDAILLGSTLVCPARGGSTQQKGGGCALDMAVLAVGGTGDWLMARKIWPWLDDDGIPAPWLLGFFDTYEWLIAISFDNYVMPERISLDQLIDWVRSVEPTPESERAIAKDVNTAPSWSISLSNRRQGGSELWPIR